MSQLVTGTEFNTPLLTPTTSVEDFANLSFVEFNLENHDIQNAGDPGLVDLNAGNPDPENQNAEIPKMPEALTKQLLIS